MLLLRFCGGEAELAPHGFAGVTSRHWRYRFLAGLRHVTVIGNVGETSANVCKILISEEVTEI